MSITSSEQAMGRPLIRFHYRTPSVSWSYGHSRSGGQVF